MNYKIHKKKVSIFMPVYNGSKYLSKSIDSVLNQTYRNFELVCVDDSSKDNSYELLKNYAKKDSRIVIFQKPNGGSVPKSWNYVLPKLTGDYIMYMSQDDHMSIDNLEKLIHRQYETKADCVLPDLQFYYEDSQNKITGRFGVNGDKDVVLSNREAVKLSLNWTIHGFALWNSKLLKDEFFPEDSFDSDEFMVRKFFLKCNKIVFCDGVFYYRQDNEKAITKSFDLKNYYTLLRDYKIYKLLKNNDFESKIIAEKETSLFKDFIKYYKYYLSRRGINSIENIEEINVFLKKMFTLVKPLRTLSVHDFIPNLFNYLMFANFSFFAWFYKTRFFIKNLFVSNNVNLLDTRN